MSAMSREARSRSTDGSAQSDGAVDAGLAAAPSDGQRHVVRDAARGDLKAVVAIERVSFSDAWTTAMFGVHLQQDAGNIFLAVVRGAAVDGYAITRTVGDESELLNIAVSPDRRGCGIGAALLDAVMTRCHREGAREMWLEVRESNVSARSLYAGRGFVPVGRRRRYYHSPREDAILLRAVLEADYRAEPADGRGTSSGGKTITSPDLSLSADRDDAVLSPASHLTREETR